MSITFRCEHCHKDVQAPDGSGGKRGRCPHCGKSSYIPSPIAEEDVLSLAPLDEQEERQRQEHTRALIEQERELLSDTAAPQVPLEHKDNLASEDLHHFVVNYCLDVVAGKLDRAEQHVAQLHRFPRVAPKAVDDFLSGDVLEPALDSIPSGVLKGFLEQLREKLE